MHEEFGIGVDIESISRFSNVKSMKDKFLNTFMTEREIDYCFSKESPFPHIAARFAGKEAIIKALGGLCISNVSFKDIEITNDKHGIPCASIRFRRKSSTQVKLSLTHSEDNAVAFAVAIKEGRDG